MGGNKANLKNYCLKYSVSNFFAKFFKPQSYNKTFLSYLSSFDETDNESDSEFDNKFVNSDKSVIVNNEKIIIHEKRI